jgi:tripartite-type tricarboxylate transporter receptor subunit TctC
MLVSKSLENKTETPMKQRTWFRFAAAVVAAIPFLAAAQPWPSKPVRVVVPFAAGGTTDVVARQLAQKLSEAWNQSVVVENRAGAGGNIGAEAVAKAPPDGYTLLMTSGSIVAANPYMYKNMGFDPAKDLAPITNVASGPQVIVISNGVAAKDLKEFIAYAKDNPKKVNFGSAGVGTQTHLAGENLAFAAGLDLVHVPYKGEAAALTDLIGGQIQMVPANFAAALPHIQGGRIRCLAVTSKERHPQLKDCPAAAESVPGFVNDGWWGLMAPAGTPREVLDKVQRDSAKILLSEEFRSRFAQQGMVPVANTPDELAAAIREESKVWARVIKERGLAQQ